MHFEIRLETNKIRFHIPRLTTNGRKRAPIRTGLQKETKETKQSKFRGIGIVVPFLSENLRVYSCEFVVSLWTDSSLAASAPASPCQTPTRHARHRAAMLVPPGLQWRQ